MTLGLALMLHVVLAADGDCYFIGNTRLLSLPSCDIGPTTIDQLTEEPAPVSPARLRQELVRRSSRNRAGTTWVRPTVAVRGNEELERRLERAEQERVTAVAQRVVAENERDVALQQRNEAVQELAMVRRELAAVRERTSHLECTSGSVQTSAVDGRGSAPSARPAPGDEPEHDGEPRDRVISPGR